MIALVALEGPLLVTVIVKVTSWPTATSSLSATFSISNSTIGRTCNLPFPTTVLFSILQVVAL